MIANNNSDTIITGIQSTDDTEGQPVPMKQPREPLELVPIYPPLSQEGLDVCIKAMKENQKLKRKVTIDNDDNLEQFLLQGFSGKRTTVYKIVNESADHSISVLAGSVGRTLERMVAESKITSTKSKIKKNGHEYNLYSINFVPDKNKDVIDSLLTTLENVFTVNSLLAEAKKHDILEETALQMLEQANTDGDVL